MDQNLTAAALHARLKELASTQPDLSIPSEARARWLGRLHQAVAQSGVGVDGPMLIVASDGLDGALAQRNQETIRNILYRALAKVEGVLPVDAQGGFIAAGNVFDALTVMTAALSTANGRALFVDPYMGPEVLQAYALMIPEGIQVDLLGGEGRIKPGLEPAAKAWSAQYGSARPLRVRVVDSKLLHDRMLIVDDSEVWDISQSLNALAQRSPATIAKSDAEQAVLKVAAYVPLFDEGDRRRFRAWPGIWSECAGGCTGTASDPRCAARRVHVLGLQ